MSTVISFKSVALPNFSVSFMTIPVFPVPQAKQLEVFGFFYVFTWLSRLSLFFFGIKVYIFKHIKILKHKTF